jgi:hypothetical protein
MSRDKRRSVDLRGSEFIRLAVRPRPTPRVPDSFGESFCHGLIKQRASNRPAGVTIDERVRTGARLGRHHRYRRGPLTPFMTLAARRQGHSRSCRPTVAFFAGQNDRTAGRQSIYIGLQPDDIGRQPAQHQCQGPATRGIRSRQENLLRSPRQLASGANRPAAKPAATARSPC